MKRYLSFLALGLGVGFLCGIFAVHYSNYASRHNDPKRSTAAKMKMLALSLDAFRLDCGAYPTQSEGLEKMRDENKRCQSRVAQSFLKQAIPLDGWERPFLYRLLDANSFELVSFGADGKSGGFGKNADLIYHSNDRAYLDFLKQP